MNTRAIQDRGHELCGEPSATRGWDRCDRAAGHTGPHTWPLSRPAPVGVADTPVTEKDQP